MSRDADELVAQAQRYIASDNVHTGVHLLREALADEPDHADAHALLALCLVDMRRVHAAQREAEIAVSLSPESRLGRTALAHVFEAKRRFRDAERLLGELRAEDPTEPAPLVGLARIALARADHDTARALLAEARALDPEDEDVAILLGRLALAEGRPKDARLHAEEVFARSPQHVAALVLAGRARLFLSDVEGARDFALWALREEANNADAIHLLVSVKARESLTLGLAWRLWAFLGTGGEGRAVSLLLAMFAVQRLATIAAKHSDMPTVASLVSFAWLGFCAYTWVAPSMFRRAIERELERVRLGDF